MLETIDDIHLLHVTWIRLHDNCLRYYYPDRSKKILLTLSHLLHHSINIQTHVETIEKATEPTILPTLSRWTASLGRASKGTSKIVNPMCASGAFPVDLTVSKSFSSAPSCPTVCTGIVIDAADSSIYFTSCPPKAFSVKVQTSNFHRVGVLKYTRPRMRGFGRENEEIYRKPSRNFPPALINFTWS